jgi:hypothetical protein
MEMWGIVRNFRAKRFRHNSEQFIIGSSFQKLPIQNVFNTEWNGLKNWRWPRMRSSISRLWLLTIRQTTLCLWRNTGFHSAQQPFTTGNIASGREPLFPSDRLVDTASEILAYASRQQSSAAANKLGIYDCEVHPDYCEYFRYQTFETARSPMVSSGDSA